MAHGPGTVELLRQIAAVAAGRSPGLYVSGLQLTSLPALPPTLRFLHCDRNQLTALPALPPTLEVLMCGTNSLTVLPALPPALEELYCNENQLTVLPALPPGLMTLNSNDNQLMALPALPPTLEELLCGRNSLTELPALPPALEILMCNQNQLAVLPALPPSLENLVCGRNQLTVLPALPQSLTNLRCVPNPISRLTFPFPPSMKNRFMQHVFAGTHLQFLPDETLEKYEARMMAHRSNTSGVSTSPLVSAVYIAPPRSVNGGIAGPLVPPIVPGGAEYNALAAQYPGPDGAPGQKKFGGLRTKRTKRTKRTRRTRSLRKRFQGK